MGVSYCDGECQKVKWEAHKLECKMRRAFHLLLASIINVARLHEVCDRPREAVEEVRALLALVCKDRVHVCKWGAEFRSIIAQAKVFLKSIWNEQLDESLAETMVLLRVSGRGGGGESGNVCV